MNAPLYVFDLDETLIDTDSATLWHQYLVEHNIITDTHFLVEDASQMQLYAKGELDMQHYLHFAMAPLASVPKQQLRQLARTFAQQRIAPLVFSQAKALLNELQQSQTTIIVISATVDYLVQAIAEELNIQHAFGIQLESNNDCFSSAIKGIATYREGKVACLEAWLKVNPHYQHHSVIFYSDSINDLPLCQRADACYVVNPCPMLNHEAQLNHWPILHWTR
ncbi:HAD family hydrolase [Vibrio rarus]|uniref:HAD family hydrolase n=1 Tax=Vibrio rarus TaxID=413403 RepID=UPI0021C3BBCE|nr:HAD family hydrolase [Vibrio rarus]